MIAGHRGVPRLLRADDARADREGARRDAGRPRAGSTTTGATAASRCTCTRRSPSRAPTSRSTSPSRATTWSPGFNVPFGGSVLPGIYTVIRSVFLDEATFDDFIPQNDGIFRPIKVIAREGSIFNPSFPRSALSRVCPILRASDARDPGAVRGRARPRRRRLERDRRRRLHRLHPGASRSTGSTSRSTRAPTAAGAARTGIDAIDVLTVNSRNTPIEETDWLFPMRTERYELRDVEPAPGRWRGGIGIIRANRFLGDGAFTSETDRAYEAPPGLFGGGAGRTLRLYRIDADGTEDPARVQADELRHARGRHARLGAGLRRWLRRSVRARSGGGAATTGARSSSAPSPPSATTAWSSTSQRTRSTPRPPRGADRPADPQGETHAHQVHRAVPVRRGRPRQPRRAAAGRAAHPGRRLRVRARQELVPQRRQRLRAAHPRRLHRRGGAGQRGRGLRRRGHGHRVGLRPGRPALAADDPRPGSRSRPAARRGDAGQALHDPHDVGAVAVAVREDDVRVRHGALLRVDPLDRQAPRPGAAAGRPRGDRVRRARARGPRGDRRGPRRRDPARLDDDAPVRRAPAANARRPGHQPGAADDQAGRALRDPRAVALQAGLHAPEVLQDEKFNSLMGVG